jgi:hypothetical protein
VEDFAPCGGYDDVLLSLLIFDGGDRFVEIDVGAAHQLGYAIRNGLSACITESASDLVVLVLYLAAKVLV